MRVFDSVLLVATCLIATLSSAGCAHTSDSPGRSVSDGEAIAKVFEGLSDAWADGDGERWGSHFTADADFMVWFGLPLEGREAIAQGHQWVFDTVYSGTRYLFDIRKIRTLTPDIVVVHLAASVVEPGDAPPESPHTLPIAVLRRTAEGWKIVAFQNLKNQLEEVEEMRARGEGTGDVRE